MKVIELTPGVVPMVADWPCEEGHTLESMQKYVEGYIETVYRLESPITGRCIDFFGNEEARLIGEPVQNDHFLKLGMDIVGPVVVIAANDDGETVGLTIEEILTVADFLHITML